MSTKCVHIVWTVPPGEVEVTTVRKRGRGRSHRVYFDTFIKVTPGRTFEIQQQAFNYARENGLPVRKVEMHGVIMGSGL